MDETPAAGVHVVLATNCPVQVPGKPATSAVHVTTFVTLAGHDESAAFFTRGDDESETLEVLGEELPPPQPASVSTATAAKVRVLRKDMSSMVTAYRRAKSSASARRKDFHFSAAHRVGALCHVKQGVVPSAGSVSAGWFRPSGSCRHRLRPRDLRRSPTR